MADSPSNVRSEEEDALRAEVMRHHAVSPAYVVFDELAIAGADHFVAMIAILRAHEIVQSNLEQALKPHRLSLAQYMMLSNLHLRGRHRPLLVGRLARRMLVHPTTVTLRLDQMEKRGLVTRERQPSDRRGVLVSLTGAGSELLESVHRELSKSQFGLSDLNSMAALSLIQGLMPVIRHDADDAARDFGEAANEDG